MIGRDTGVPPDSRIEFRIGINVGDIVVEDGDIFGDGVNVAARLEALAEPGGICVAARVQQDAAGKLALAFEDVGEQQLKNIARPVRAYRVITSPRPATPQVGTGPPLPDKPSIAVLPFANMSGDPEQEYFADGMVEENTSQAPDPSNSAAFTSPARCQVDSLMDFFGLAVNRLLSEPRPQDAPSDLCDELDRAHNAVTETDQILVHRWVNSQQNAGITPAVMLRRGSPVTALACC
jgi:hypothetical protein